MVQARLVDANLRRRNRFNYAQKHSMKLAAEVPPPMELGTIQNATELHLQQAEEHPVTQSQNLPIDVPQGIPAEGTAPSVPGLTATSASDVGTKIDDVPAPLAAPPQAPMTQITSIAAKIRYPRPPQLRASLSSFKCPCCCQTLPAMFQQSTQWK